MDWCHFSTPMEVWNCISQNFGFSLLCFTFSLWILYIFGCNITLALYVFMESHADMGKTIFSQYYTTTITTYLKMLLQSKLLFFKVLDSRRDIFGGKLYLI